ncbi:MAG TPA: hypothetical protein VJX67_22065 [Blastocatellia bacterium]|nr:hypothetical protein [Blastocatellia bacterium]
MNPHVLTVEEFARRKNAGDHFLTTVLGEPKLLIIESEDELKAMENDGWLRPHNASRQEAGNGFDSVAALGCLEENGSRPSVAETGEPISEVPFRS